jgi:hypothetical protein
MGNDQPSAAEIAAMQEHKRTGGVDPDSFRLGVLAAADYVQRVSRAVNPPEARGHFSNAAGAIRFGLSSGKLKPPSVRTPEQTNDTEGGAR